MTNPPITKKPASSPPSRGDATHHVDATNLVVGRLASHVAQDLLKGKRVIIVNAEKAVFTGNPIVLSTRWQKRLDLRPKGNPEFGPRFSKMPDRILKEIIEGMLPSKRMRGREALRRLRVYIGTPTQYEGKTFEPLEKARNQRAKGVFSVLQLAESIGYTGLKDR
ncbi:MAG: 50S ribosomal protein L13 [Candidatus Diapherotrites archaeon]|nr:50S ribosomal protein L13 [Candidatus Diapherotrites archaeon]MDZ4256799.1 50S ribosomal protein L13 [archaeon]